jgi:hypothetical protein
MESKYKFRFEVLGRYPARTKGGRSAVTVNLASGTEDRLVFAGTITMSDDEWTSFVSALERALGPSVDIVDHSAETTPQDKARAI